MSNKNICENRIIICLYLEYEAMPIHAHDYKFTVMLNNLW